MLIGGGHAHVEVLRRFALQPAPDLRIAVVSPSTHTPYSGMLPGWIAGHYTRDEVHIDLRPLCAKTGARLITDQAVGLEPGAGRVRLKRGPPLAYDLLSLNSGSNPALDLVPGAADHAVAVKPVGRFIAWLDGLAAAKAHLRIGVIGAGAAGCEVVMALRHRFAQARIDLALHLIDRAPDVLPGYPPPARARVRRALQERAVRLHLGHAIARVDATGITDGTGAPIALDQVVMATGAAAPAWLRESGLDLDQRGFVQVGPTLQSVSEPRVFAAGDVAAFAPGDLPKAGVYAVREGPALASNLRLVAGGRPPQAYEPQRSFLSLISLGEKKAVASRGRLVFDGAFAWWLKDRIDRRFMRRYARL